MPNELRFYGSPAFLPAVQSIGSQVWTRDQPQARGDHSHDRSWEVHYLASGRLEWWIDGVLCSLQAGDCFVAAPGQVHTGIDRVLHRSRVMWLCLPLTGRGALPWLDTRERRSLAERFERLERWWFPAGDTLGAAFVQLREAITERQVTIARASIYLVLAQTLQAHDRARDHGQLRAASDALVGSCIAMLGQDLTALPTIDALAQRLDCSRATLYRRFHAQTGMSPVSYWQRMRVQRAKALLAAGNQANEVAAALGFSHAQHFGRRFKQYTGSSPAAWQREVETVDPTAE